MMAGTFRQHDTHTQDALRALTEASPGCVCLGRLGLGYSGNSLKDRARESLLNERGAAAARGFRLSPACLWATGCGLLVLAKASGIYSKFYREAEKEGRDR